jgi:hypothetical protein
LVAITQLTTIHQKNRAKGGIIMAKIKITDLAQDQKISKEEMKNVFGGLSFGQLGPRSSLRFSAMRRPAIGLGFGSQAIDMDCWSHTACACGKQRNLFAR